MTTLKEMAEYLSDHQMYASRREGNRLAWDIKVHSFDTSGHKNEYDYKADPKYDKLWAEHLERRGDELFSMACEDGMRIFFEDKGENFFAGFADDHPLSKAVQSTTMYQEGRSGGWLVLDAINDYNITTDTDWHDLAEEDSDLLKLVYHVCQEINKFNPKEELEYQYAFQRSKMEEEWEDAEKKTIQKRKDLRMIGTFIYLRAHPIKNRAVIEAAKRLRLPVTPDGKVSSNVQCNSSSG